MKRFGLTRELMGASIAVQVFCLRSGFQIGVYGGTLPHIGAVSVADPQGNITTQQFPTHKDGIISERWARALSEAGYRPAVVTAGIHYDHLNREQIAAVVEITDSMLSELLCALRDADAEIDL